MEKEKGRCGNFRVFLVGKMAWEVRDKNSGQTVAYATNMSGAFSQAEKLAMADGSLFPKGNKFLGNQ